MSERRLNPHDYQNPPILGQVVPKPHDKLKAVAGLIQGLSYREMCAFVDALSGSVSAQEILQAADAILAGKNA